MGIRDIIHPMPGKRQELADYILKHYKNVREAVDSNPGNRALLESAVDESFQKYSGYLGNITGKVSGAGHAVGYAADAWLLGTGDIVGTLGGKFLNLLAQVPEKMYGIVYGVQTGNYLDAARNIFQGMLSYIPGLTFVDEGLERIVQKRMVKDALTRFEKGSGMYKPWTAKLSEKLAPHYTGVRDRQANVFTPAYQPSLA
ncbi:hypothetical protein HYU11_06070 [Candidatus Woesearchaeota archaeon]|nr:hypothetical protein [Candidatus Woesearchaeota archaeon]